MSFDFPTSTKKRLKISRTMNDSQNIDPKCEWPVENEHVFKSGDAKHAQRLQRGMLQARPPSDIGMSSKKREGFMRGCKEPYSDFEIGFAVR